MKLWRMPISMVDMDMATGTMANLVMVVLERRWQMNQKVAVRLFILIGTVQQHGVDDSA